MPLISTQNLTLLPDPAKLRVLLRSMAMLDAILYPEWEFRYYSFNSRWSRGKEMGSMRNGQGDDFFALFNADGCFLKGFVHDSPVAASQIDPAKFYHGIPTEFAACVSEPAFSTGDVTFCLWRSFNDLFWHRNAIDLPRGDDVDGSEYLLSPLTGHPEQYQQWAESYYERDVDLQAVTALFELQRLTDDLVMALNPELSMNQIIDDVRKINYPI